MDNFDVSPMLFQILGYEPPMASVRLVLAAQQASVGDNLFRNRRLNSPLAHKRNEAILVGCPFTTPFPVVVQQLLRRGQRGQVNVLHPAELAQEKREVVLLRKTGKLRAIVEPHVDDTLDARLTKQIKKTVGRLFCESDGRDFHGGQLLASQTNYRRESIPPPR